jgi:hypothetical protein
MKVVVTGGFQVALHVSLHFSRIPTYLALAPQGRHPLLERRGQASYQPNDTHVDSLWSSLHLVTGPNMVSRCS